MRKFGWIAGWLLMGASAIAGEVVESNVSSGVLRAEGMMPGSVYTVEWASVPGEGYTNNPALFDGLTADSNGVVEVAIPMFFRVIGILQPPSGMVFIPGGTNEGADPDFGDYSLTVASFYMDATEVTKAQWDTVYTWAVTNGYSFDNEGLGKGTDHPVHAVNWYDCVKWCNARSEKEGRTPVYTVSGNVYRTGSFGWDESHVVSCDFNANGYRLPTSDEWEYAARGGLSGKRFPWGDAINHSHANYRARGSAYPYDTSSYTTMTYHPTYNDGTKPYTSPVGSFAANGYGLYDMSGNVWEWCWDQAGSNHSNGRVKRGESWDGLAFRARCGSSTWEYPHRAYSYFGFRAVCR